MKTYISIDGNKINDSLPIRTLFYGEGVFETFRYKNQLPILFDKHLDRMEKGAKLLDLPFIDRDYINNLVESSISESKIGDAYVKICLFSSGNSVFFKTANQSQLAVIIKEYQPPLASVKVANNSFRRISTSPLNNIKSLNYLENILARRQALSKHYDDSVFLNEWGEITECSASNIFWYKGGRFFTPHINCGLLEGTTRGLVLEVISNLGQAKSEGGYLLDDLNDAEFVFITNSLIGAVPLSSMDEISFDTENSKFLELKNELLNRLNWE